MREVFGKKLRQKLWKRRKPTNSGKRKEKKMTSKFAFEENCSISEDIEVQYSSTEAGSCTKIHKEDRRGGPQGADPLHKDETEILIAASGRSGGPLGANHHDCDVCKRRNHDKGYFIYQCRHRVALCSNCYLRNPSCPFCGQFRLAL